jgi:spermidine/putrescine transport system substrate-binding protein
MIDSLIDGVMVAAIYGGAANPFDMTAAGVETTRALLKKQLPLLRYYSNSMANLQTSLASGDLVAAAVWNEAYVGLIDEGHPVTFATDMPGLVTWTYGLTLNAWTENEATAYDVMNSMLSPDASVYEIMEWGYGHANTKSCESISDENLSARGLSRTPNEIIAAGIFQAPIVNEPELQSIFEEVKAGF